MITETKIETEIAADTAIEAAEVAAAGTAKDRPAAPVLNHENTSERGGHPRNKKGRKGNPAHHLAQTLMTQRKNGDAAAGMLRLY